MAHDVFVSHSSKDKTIADATCAYLETRNIRCWIAPRDILPGADWGVSIVDAIKGSRVMVLILSASANASPQIKREVERAVHHGNIIIPMRIEDVMPAKELEYFLSTPHWLDAFTTPLESHLEFLSTTIQQILSGASDDRDRRNRPLPVPVPWWRKHMLLLGVGVVSAVVIFLLMLILLRPSPVVAPVSSNGGATAATGASIDQFTGKWKRISSDTPITTAGTYVGLPTIIQAEFAGTNPTVDLTIHDDGSYEVHTVTTDKGTYTASPLQPDGSNFIAQGSFQSDISGAKDSITFMINIVAAGTQNPNLPPGNLLMTLAPQGGGAGTYWARNGDAGSPTLPGKWTNPSVPIMDSIAQHFYQSTLDLADDGHYQLQFELTEKGLFQLDGQKYSLTSGGMMPQGGQYSFQSKNKFTWVSGSGKSVWERE